MRDALRAGRRARRAASCGSGPSRRRQWNGAAVWIHCDLDARNVLVRAGRLAAVLDWGGAGAGDPALDVMVAWKLVARDERERFRALLDVDDATWQRAQGWARRHRH